MTLAYTLVNVGFSVSQVTVTACDVTVVQPAALGETVSVMVTGPGADGQVNTGLAVAASLNVPADAVHANVAPGDAVDVRTMLLLTVVSSGNTETELMFAHTTVVPFTTTVPLPPAPGLHASVMPTVVVIPAVTLKLAEPEQVNDPSTDVAVSVML